MTDPASYHNQIPDLLAMQKERASRAYQITAWGIAGNLFLIVFKLLAGILGNSRAIVADAAHSVSDFASDLVVITGVKLGNRPPDSTHRYGHGKFETLSALILGCVLLLTAIGIAVSAGGVFLRFSKGIMPPPPGWIAVLAAATSILIKEVLYRVTVQVGRTIESQAVVANAVHHRSDAFSSGGVLIGITGAILLGESWRILDAAAALVVVVFIVKIALSIMKTSVNELLERSLDDELGEEIVGLVGKIAQVGNPHNIKTRRIGTTIAIDLHIDVAPELNIREAHTLATEVEEVLKNRYGTQTFVSVHVEPAEESNGG